MPLRMIDYAGFSYAYIIMLLNGDRCTVLVYSGTFDHFELTRLLMHHCEHTITSMSANDGVFWTWMGTRDTLRTVIGTGLFCSCAYCFKRKALCMSQKCEKCHYFRYCSKWCHKKHWKRGHRAMCTAMSQTYNHMARRVSDYEEVVYGFMSAYDYFMWQHILNDPAFIARE